MANNVITAVIPKILAQGLVALRQNSVTPRLVANMTSSIAGVKGSTIDVPIASAITAVAVTPATTAPAAAAISPTTVPVVLDQWYEAPFDLSDNEYEQAMEVPNRTAKNHLKRLTDLGFLRRTGAGRATRYEVVR